MTHQGRFKAIKHIRAILINKPLSVEACLIGRVQGSKHAFETNSAVLMNFHHQY